MKCVKRRRGFRTRALNGHSSRLCQNVFSSGNGWRHIGWGWDLPPNSWQTIILHVCFGVIGPSRLTRYEISDIISQVITTLIIEELPGATGMADV